MTTAPTPFTKQNLIKDGAYIFFVPDGAGPYHPDRKFIARFKHARGSQGPFMTFLRRNFTAEEYLARMEADETPLRIAESKGFMLSHIKKMLKQSGYPLTQVGFKQYLADAQTRRDAMA